VVQEIRAENGSLVLHGYPEGATVHGIEGPGVATAHRIHGWTTERSPLAQAHSQRRFGGNFRSSFHICRLGWRGIVSILPLLRFGSPFKAFEKESAFSRSERPTWTAQERQKLVAHDDQGANGVFSLIVRSRDLTAIEAVSLSLPTPFVVLPELKTLRSLSQFVFDWVKKEHGRVAGEIVQAFDMMPAYDRAAAPPFGIKVETKDYFAPKNERARHKWTS
jgi:hypothetical protein